MPLIRSSQSLHLIKETYQQGRAEKELRSYYLPEYQRNLIDIIAEDTGLSKGGVVREIINEWYELRVKSAENGSS